MSIVMSFELNKTYGTQNEDVAKKNKYNSIQVKQNVVTNNNEGQIHDYIAEFSESTSSSGNTFSNTHSLRNVGNGGNNLHGKFHKLNNDIGQVYYKSYSVSLSLSQYTDLTTKTSAPVFDWMFSGSKYEEIYNEEKAHHATAISYNPTQFETFQTSAMQQDQFGAGTSDPDKFSSATYTVTDNIYSKDSVDYDAFEEMNQNIQDGYNNTRDPNFSKVYDIIKPEITNWVNNGTTITFDIKLPYMAKFFDGMWRDYYDDSYYRLGEWFGLLEGYDTSYSYYEYTFSSIKIRFYNDYEITGSEDAKFYTGDRVYNADDSFLFEKGVYYSGAGTLPAKFASEIYENYQNGKTSLDIKYPLGPIYDDMDNQLYYVKNVGIVRKLGDKYYDADGNIVVPADEESISENFCPEEGMKCIVTKGGTPIEKNDDSGDIQYYYVQNANMGYDGVALNELTLVESNTESDTYTVLFDTPEHCTMRVNYYIDAYHPSVDISTGASVKKGGYLYIYFTFDTHYGLPQYKIYINGQPVGIDLSYIGTRWKWYITGNATIVAPVQYLGGKYLFLNLDDGISLNSGSHLVDGMEIYTNQELELSASIAEGYTAQLFINGEEYPDFVDSYGIHKNITVYDKDIHISIPSEFMGVTSDISQDVLDYFTITRVSSVYSDNSITNIVANTQLYKEDVIKFTTNQSNYILTVNGSPVSTNTNITVTGDIVIRAYVGQQTLENLTWDEIDTISKTGYASNILTVGDTKTFSTTEGYNLTARIVGFNKDKDTNNNWVGITFDIEEVLPSGVVMNQTQTNSGGWGASYMRNTIMPQIYDTLPSALKNVIKTVRKKSVIEAGEYASGDVIEWTNDKLWLFSDAEIYPYTMSTDYSPPSEYTIDCYNLWANNTTASDRKKLVAGANHSSAWWTRSIFFARPQNDHGTIIHIQGWDTRFKMVMGRMYDLNDEAWTDRASGYSRYEEANKSYGYVFYVYNPEQTIGISFGFCI